MVVCAFVQPTNSPAVVSLLIDFEAGSEKKYRRKLLDREADGLRSLRKTSVADRLSLRFPIAGGEQLRLGAVIKGDPSSLTVDAFVIYYLHIRARDILRIAVMPQVRGDRGPLFRLTAMLF